MLKPPNSPDLTPSSIPGMHQTNMSDPWKPHLRSNLQRNSNKICCSCPANSLQQLSASLAALLSFSAVIPWCLNRTETHLSMLVRELSVLVLLNLKVLNLTKYIGNTKRRTMYSFMGGGLLCAGVGNILLVVSTATDYWMQYRQASSYMHQGLWRYCVPGKCMMHTDSIAYWDATRAFMILAVLACFFGLIIGIMAFINYTSFGGFDKTFAAGILYFMSSFFVLLAMAIYTGVTVNYYGKRYGNWRFAWSYILGWVSVVLTFFSGIFYMCAYRMHAPIGPMSR